MIHYRGMAFVTALALLGVSAMAADPPPAQKEFFGRKVANFMHHTGAPWLIRATREKEENTTMLMGALQIRPGQVVCDLGCGNGYHSLKMAKLVGDGGRVYGVDIQKEMLRYLQKRADAAGVKNVVPVLGQVHDPKLKPNSCDLILLVDVYHELSHPEAMLARIREALKPTGQLALIEFRSEDASVPIKLLHKMSKQQMIKEVCPNGFRVTRQFNQLPWQHAVFFGKTKLKDLKVLLVGNQDLSQNDLPKRLEALGAAAKIAFETKLIATEGFTLQKHFDSGEVAKTITQFEPDVVIFQPNARNAAQQPLETRLYAQKLHALASRAGAKSILFMPWTTGEAAGTHQGLKALCLSLGEDLGTQVATVGKTFVQAKAADKRIELVKADGSGATEAGTYLAACVTYATVTGRDPRGLPTAGLQVPDALAHALQAVAWASVNTRPAYAIHAN